MNSEPRTSVTPAVSKPILTDTKAKDDTYRRLLCEVKANCKKPDWLNAPDDAKGKQYFKADVVTVFGMCATKLANLHPSPRELESALVALRDAEPKDWNATGSDFGLEIDIEKKLVKAHRLPRESLKWLETSDSRNFYTTSRSRILIRDGGLCVYCGEDVLRDGAHMDHLVPLYLVPGKEDETACPTHPDKDNKGPAPKEEKKQPEPPKAVRQNGSANVVTACAACNFAKAGRLPFPTGQMTGRTRGQLIQRLQKLIPEWKKETIDHDVREKILALRKAAMPIPEARGPDEYALSVWRYCANEAPTIEMKNQARNNYGEEY